MKVIFLDIPGVLNNMKSAEIYGHGDLSVWNVWRLNKIVKETGAIIVFCSPWFEYTTLEQLFRLLKTTGYLGDAIDILYDDKQPKIQNIESYVVLDNNIDANNDNEHHIFVDSVYGLRDEHVYKAINILNS